ncbi:hypothetical protein RFI_36037, partial [Reticulomyxa filosa]
NIERIKAYIPSKTIILDKHSTFLNSFRYALYHFLKNELLNGLETFSWFIFQEYNKIANTTWNLASCPHCRRPNIQLDRSKMTKDYIFICPECNKDIYISDTLRLHEIIDEVAGASAALEYLSTALKQFVMIACIKAILSSVPEEMKILQTNYSFLAVGLEKSGSFVEHAKQIDKLLKPGKRKDDNEAFGNTTYYGVKIIFKSQEGRVYVATLPIPELNNKYQVSDVNNIHEILTLLSYLKCDMYDNALLPVTLANKLISIANHPSATILQKFASGKIDKR